MTLTATLMFLGKNARKLYHLVLNPDFDVLEDPASEIRMPLALAAFAVVAFAGAAFPDTVKLRPFPAFWRCLLGVMLCYVVFMTLILLLPVN